MKYLKCFAVVATAVMLASCGGSSKSESGTEKKAEENAEKTVTVKDDDVKFRGDFRYSAALVPGDYTLKLSGKTLDIEVTATVLDEAQKGVSGSSTLFLLDENGKEIAEMHLMGGQTDLSNNMKTGSVDAKSTLSFSHYDDGASDVFKKARYIKAGELKAVEETDDNDNVNADVDGSGLSKTLSEYGVTYVCVHDPVENDKFLASFDLGKVMQDKDKIIEAWEIFEEELLRYQFASGETGADNPEAYARSEAFRNGLHPKGGYSDEDPIGYMQNREYSYESSDDFTQAQKDRIKKFKTARDKAFNDWRSAK